MFAFQKIGTDRERQGHWIRRLVAGTIDSMITWIVAWIILTFVAPPAPSLLNGATWFGVFPFLSGVVFLLYASFLESIGGATIGKQIMYLKVTTIKGNVPDLKLSILRNVSKIHGTLWLIDTLIGLAMVGDPYQKCSDRYIGTTVTSTVEKDLIITTIEAYVAPATPPINA